MAGARWKDGITCSITHTLVNGHLVYENGRFNESNKGSRLHLAVDMQIDQYTYNDLSIFHPEEEFSVFHRLNFTRTVGGRIWLKKYFHEPFSELEKIIHRKASIKLILRSWINGPLSITNGTILVLDKFLRLQSRSPSQSGGNMNSYTVPASAFT